MFILKNFALVQRGAPVAPRLDLEAAGPETLLGRSEPPVARSASAARA